MSDAERLAPGYDELTPEAREFHDKKTQSPAEPLPEIGRKTVGLAPGETRLSPQAKDELAEKRMWPDDTRASETRQQLQDIKDMRELAAGMRIHGAFGLPDEQVESMAKGLEETADKLEKE